MCWRSCTSSVGVEVATMTQPAFDTPLVIAGREMRSRLMVGTGKYPSNEVMVEAIQASGFEDTTTLQSFDWAALDYARTLDEVFAAEKSSLS